MFTESFKYYKAKWPVPDLQAVIDFNEQRTASETVRELHLKDDFMDLQPPLGIRPVHEWQCYTLAHHPGLIVIRNAFSIQGQRYWVARCLRDYPRHPNRVNLSPRLFVQSVLDDWWSSLQRCNDENEARRLRISMRWTTLGYHHDWDSKVYSERLHTTFPDDLAELCEFFAIVLGYEGFTGQAAIVNYYPIGTTLAGHTDHSELNLEAPLFSFSFGQTAVFLIGGTSKDTKPTPLFLESGDVLVMSRESRLCYHAVPRVMKARSDPWNTILANSYPYSPNPAKKARAEYASLQTNTGNAVENGKMDTLLYQQVADEVFWAPFKTYLNDSRININVRQVLPNGATKLN